MPYYNVSQQKVAYLNVLGQRGKRNPFPLISSQILHFLGTLFPGSRKMCYPGSNQEKVNKNCPSVRRGKLETMNTIREEIRANLCWLSLVIGQRSVVLCFTVTGCETIEATADTGRMLLPLPSNEKKAGKLQRCKLHIVQDHDFNRVVDTIGCFVAHMKTSLAGPS